MLTLEERERRAYIEGRVEEAALLGAAMDSAPEFSATQHRIMQSRVAELQLINGRLEASVAAMRKREQGRA